MTGRAPQQEVVDSTVRSALTTPQVLLDAPGFLVRRIYQAYIAAWVRQVNGVLTGPQFAVLVVVSENPGSDQGSLASAVSLDRSTMADIARRLEEKGLITRALDVHDGRRRLLHLTPEGQQVLAGSNVRARRLDEQLLGELNPDERAQVMTVLQRLSERWSTVAADGGGD